MANTKNKLAYEKGRYGHAKSYKNSKILLTFVCFAMILSDILISLIMFQTKKTLFMVVACVIAIPFAKNLLAFFMSLKGKPLSKEEYDALQPVVKETGPEPYYDIYVTDTDGTVFFPYVAVYNNNVIAYSRDAKDMEKKKISLKFLEQINETSKDDARIVVVESMEKYKKEFKKINPPSEAQALQDEKIGERLLQIGF